MSNHKPEYVLFTNMCVIEDENNNVLAIDKVTGSYRGTTFPGGHIEKNEVFNESVIREIKEETGLTIKNQSLCGVYHWYRDDIHNVLFIYHAKEFSGSLNSSREGRVYWIPLEDLKKKELATGTQHVIEMIENRNINECVMRPDGDTYTGTLY